uniref:Uncharacterized protein n=1 Tax=Anguilla anguilla TaxID=7936 RepID=A0A0E9PC86_ANGAN
MGTQFNELDINNTEEHRRNSESQNVLL